MLMRAMLMGVNIAQMIKQIYPCCVPRMYILEAEPSVGTGGMATTTQPKIRSAEAGGAKC